MKLKKLILNVTDQCNFNCTYCYQKKNITNRPMDWETCRNAIDFFIYNSQKKISIDFSGGEPLLNFELIKKALNYCGKQAVDRKKKVNYSIITNGSLVTDEIIAFFAEHQFSVQFSFDSILQDSQRMKGSFKKGLLLLLKLLNTKNLDLSVTPVITSKSVGNFYDSLIFLKEQGVKNIDISLDQTRRWNIRSRRILEEQLDLVKDMELENFTIEGKTLLNLFTIKEKPGIHGCSAGSSQISISPNGDIWGCPAFSHLNWKRINPEEPVDYILGNINDLSFTDLAKNYGRANSNYSDFRTDNYYTDNSRCFLCKYLQECSLCPAIDKRSSNSKKSIFYIPHYICEINKILIKSNQNFKTELNAKKK